MTIGNDDKAAIEALLARQSAAWRAGDAAAFGADAADGVIFTNVVGMFSIGLAPFNAQHERIFATIYKGSTMDQEVVAITLIRPDVAIVDTLARVGGSPHRPPGVELIDGEIRSRLEQVMVKESGAWRVASFHNVAVHPASLAGPPGGS